MFTLYHSNQLDLLKSLVAELIKHDPINDVFEQEVILVQSQGMNQWLQMQLAQEFNIAANVNLLFPNQFIEQIYQAIVPKCHEEALFDTQWITWRLLTILRESIDLPEFKAVKQYLNNQHDDKKYYQFATRLAVLFDQYMVYRPDWIEKWENHQLVFGLDASQEWQAILWRALYLQSDSPIYHRAKIHHMALNRLKKHDFDTSQLKSLPKRIFIFGIVSLPPTYLTLLHQLGQYIDIHFMFLNPCKYYWGDMMDERALYQIKKAHEYGQDGIKTQLYFQELENSVKQFNPLLASWGKLGRDNIALLQQFDKRNDIEAFVDNPPNSLLQKLQHDILNLENSIESQNKTEIKLDDGSLSFHQCHSEQREVETLYDYLLSVLDHHPDISLRDCVVMVPDIDHYMPYIQAVFGSAKRERYLPYTVSDQQLKSVNINVRGFLQLLTLPNCRFELAFIFELLEIPAIAKRFSIDEASIKQLQIWTIESGIRWGLDPSKLTSYHWLTGLKRMLLGYTMNSELGGWQDIFPYEGTTGLETELVGQFADLVSTLLKWYELLNQSRTIEQWQPFCLELLQDFFYFESNNEPIFLFINEEWNKIIDYAKLANFQEQLSITILHDAVQNRLEHSYLSHRFLVGKINFCTMMPMRAIPFKVVCLLGMNDGHYPRASLPLNFDLIAQSGRIGDRNRRNDDRYLFLEALLSAQQKLYISFIGRDIQTNAVCYPSVLVEELLDYITQSYISDKVENALDYVKEQLIYEHTRTPFNSKNYQINQLEGKIWQSYSSEWLPAALNQGKQSCFIQPLPPVYEQNITVAAIKQFYQHTIKALQEKRLGIFINNKNGLLPDAEPFNLDSLQKYQLNSQLLDELLANNDDKNSTLYQSLTQSNQLPSGVFGELLFNQQKKEVEELATKILQEKQEQKSIDINLDIAHYRLQGQIAHIQSDGILRWRAGKLTVKDGISLWIDHLLLAVTNQHEPLINNRIYGRDNTIWRFDYIEYKTAYDYLTALIEGYQKGMNEPLFMPLLSSWQWIENAYDIENRQITNDENRQQKAWQFFIHSWEGGFIISELDDYYLRLYPVLTDELINHAITSAKSYLLPMRQYKIEQP